MQFSVSREAILKPLQRLGGVIERNQTQPILSNVMIAVKNQLLSLTGTDLEIEMIARIPLTTPATPGKTTISSKKIMDICKALPEKSNLTFESKEEKMTVRSGRSRYSLACLPAENFPKVEESPGDVEISVPQGILRQLLDVITFAMAQQDVRYYLNGVLIEFNQDVIRVVATDGHRLATMALPLKTHLTQPLSVILPRKAVLEMQRLFAEGEEEIGLVIGKNHLRAVMTHTSFIAKLIEGKFPHYQRVLPATEGHRLTLPRNDLRQALLRVSALFVDKYRGVGLQFSANMLRIVAVTPDKDEVEDELEIAYDGPAMEIGVNASYLIEYLNIMKSEQVELAFTDPSQVILFESKINDDVRHAYVVMPLRL